MPFDKLGGSGGASTAFTTLQGDAGTSPVADSSTDTLTVAGGTNVTTTGDSTTDTLTIDFDPTGGVDMNSNPITECPAISSAANGDIEMTSDGQTTVNSFRGSVNIYAYKEAAAYLADGGKVRINRHADAATATTEIGGAALNVTSTAITVPAGTIARAALATGTNYRILANSSLGVSSENAALTSGRLIKADSNGQLTSSTVTGADVENMLNSQTARLGEYFRDEFDTASNPATNPWGSQGWVASTTGGQIISDNSEPTRPGVYKFQLGTAAANRTAIHHGTQSVRIGNGYVVWRCGARIPILSTVTDEFHFKAGLFNQMSTTEPSNAVSAGYWRVNHGDYWYVTTMSNSSRTYRTLDGTGAGAAATVSTPVVAGDWVDWECIINSAGTTADFYAAVNGGQMLWRTQMTANIPADTALVSTTQTGPAISAIRLVGATLRYCDVDYFEYMHLFSTPRWTY
jgi:hypothetical protein